VQERKALSNVKHTKQIENVLLSFTWSQHLTLSFNFSTFYRNIL